MNNTIYGIVARGTSREFDYQLAFNEILDVVAANF
jgi:hypothetical protein